MKKLFVLTALFVALVGGIVWYSGGSAALELPNLEKLAAQAKAEPEIGSAGTEDTQETGQAATKTSLLNSLTETRAVWVATAYAIDYPSEPTTDADTLKARCNEILDEAAANGCNTVYFQVRPAADAL